MTTNRHRMPRLLLVAAVLFSLACGRLLSGDERVAAWCKQGEQLLSGAAMAAIGGNSPYRVWDLENGHARIDDERFPEWARDEYDACVYWEAPYTESVHNDDRRPGNSAMFIQVPCIAWGWILLGKRNMHVLELGNEYGIPGVPNIIMSGWDEPATSL